MTRSATSRRLHETPALLLRRVEVGESDLVVTLLTESLGRVTALARAARKSHRRFGGSLEPLHGLRVRLEERAGHELLVLTEVRLETIRPLLVSDLDRMQAAGQALSWVRAATAPRVREDALWRALTEFLDDLALPEPPQSAAACLASLGFELLRGSGWALELERCVGCGANCREGRAAMVDPRRGGLLCRACGGASLRLDGALRMRLVAASRGATRVMSADAAVALALVDRAVATHIHGE